MRIILTVEPVRMRPISPEVRCKTSLPYSGIKTFRAAIRKLLVKVVNIAITMGNESDPRIQLFSEVYELLNNKGYFINGDLIKSKYEILDTKYYDDVWASYIQVIVVNIGIPLLFFM